MNPEIGTWYVRSDATALRVMVLAVGERTLYVRSDTGHERCIDLDVFATEFVVAPDPFLTAELTIYDVSNAITAADWADRPTQDVRRIVIHPDGTWTGYHADGTPAPSVHQI